MYADGEVIEVARWAHARRKFFDAMKSDAARAQIALAHIRELYSIEKRGRDLGEAERRDLRVVEGKPLLDAFKSWLDAEAKKVLPKSPISEAESRSLHIRQIYAIHQSVSAGIWQKNRSRAADL